MNLKECDYEIAGQTLLSPTLDDMEPQSGINQSVAMAIAGTSAFGQKTNDTETHPSLQQVRKKPFKNPCSGFIYIQVTDTLTWAVPEFVICF
jgi:hypothetical protein